STRRALPYGQSNRCSGAKRSSARSTTLHGFLGWVALTNAQPPHRILGGTCSRGADEEGSWCKVLIGMVWAADAVLGAWSRHDSQRPYLDRLAVRGPVAALALDGDRPLHGQPSRQVCEARLRLGEPVTDRFTGLLTSCGDAFADRPFRRGPASPR